MDMVTPFPEDLVEIVEEDLVAFRFSQLGGQNLRYAAFETQVCGEEQPPHSQALHSEIYHPLVGYAAASIGVDGRSIAQRLANRFPIPASADVAVDDHGFGIAGSDRREVICSGAAWALGVAPVLSRIGPMHEQRRLELDAFLYDRKIPRIRKPDLRVKLTQHDHPGVDTARDLLERLALVIRIDKALAQKASRKILHRLQHEAVCLPAGGRCGALGFRRGSRHGNSHLLNLEAVGRGNYLRGRHTSIEKNVVMDVHLAVTADLGEHIVPSGWGVLESSGHGGETGRDPKAAPIYFWHQRLLFLRSNRQSRQPP